MRSIQRWVHSVAITCLTQCALHAEGPRFKPQRNHIHTGNVPIMARLTGRTSWCFQMVGGKKVKVWAQICSRGQLLTHCAQKSTGGAVSTVAAERENSPECSNLH